MDDQVQSGTTQRSIFLRILFCALWFIPIWLVSQITIGAIVGGITGASATTYDAGYATGQAAAAEFFRQYGLLVFGLQIALTIALSWLGLLPGTAKFKKRR